MAPPDDGDPVSAGERWRAPPGWPRRPRRGPPPRPRQPPPPPDDAADAHPAAWTLVGAPEGTQAPADERAGARLSRARVTTLVAVWLVVWAVAAAALAAVGGAEFAVSHLAGLATAPAPATARLLAAAAAARAFGLAWLLLAPAAAAAARARAPRAAHTFAATAVVSSVGGAPPALAWRAAGHGAATDPVAALEWRPPGGAPPRALALAALPPTLGPTIVLTHAITHHSPLHGVRRSDISGTLVATLAATDAASGRRVRSVAALDLAVGTRWGVSYASMVVGRDGNGIPTLDCGALDSVAPLPAESAPAPARARASPAPKERAWTGATFGGAAAPLSGRTVPAPSATRDGGGVARALSLTPDEAGIADGIETLPPRTVSGALSGVFSGGLLGERVGSLAPVPAAAAPPPPALPLPSPFAPSASSPAPANLPKSPFSCDPQPPRAATPPARRPPPAVPPSPFGACSSFEPPGAGAGAAVARSAASLSPVTSGGM